MTPAEFRAARKALGLTQTALAKRLALAVRTIRRAETKGPTVVETLAMHWLSREAA